MYIAIFQRVIFTEFSLLLHPTYLTFPCSYWVALQKFPAALPLCLKSLPPASPLPNYTEQAKGGFKNHPNFENKIIINRCFISGTLENSPAGRKFVYMEAVILTNLKVWNKLFQELNSIATYCCLLQL